MNPKLTQSIKQLFTVVLLLLPLFAAGAVPFTAAASGLSADVMTIITPLAGLAVIAIGLLAITNVIHWGWLAGALIGMGLIFGHDQVVAWFRGLMAV